MASITDMVPGDYVKYKGDYLEIHDIYGVSYLGHLAKPSEGGFWVLTTCGLKVDMWHAEGYYKKEDLPNELRKSTGHK